MRAVHLRSSAIGHYKRPQTEAPLAIFVLALIAAAGVALPWAHGLRWSKRGWSYEEGLVALGAAVAVAAVSAARANGRIRRSWFHAVGLGCALVGLVSTLWFYSDVVGSSDPFTWMAQLFGGPYRIVGAVGLYVSMGGFLCQTAVFIWHVDFRVQWRLRVALRSPWTVAVLLGVVALGVRLPWNNSWPTPDRGQALNEGRVVLIATAAAGILCGLRLLGYIRTLPYAVLGLLCAAVGVAAVAWFRTFAIGGVDWTGYALLVRWLNAPRLESGVHESVTAAGVIATFAVFSWQLWDARRAARRV